MEKYQIDALNLRLKSLSPILKLINVEEGIACITDLEAYYLTEVNAPDGLYSIEGNQLIPATRETEFPKLELGENKHEILLEKGTLLPFFNYLASKDNVQYAMQGIHFDNIDGKLNIAATDEYILMSRTLPIAFDGVYTAPLKNIMERVVKRMAKDKLRITFYDGYVCFGGTDEQVIVKTNDSTYPGYRSIIPTAEYVELFTMSTKELKSLIAANKQDADGNKIEYMHIKDGQMRFCSHQNGGKLQYKLENKGRKIQPSIHDFRVIMGMSPKEIHLNPKLVQKVLDGNEMTFYYKSNQDLHSPYIVEVK